MTVNAVHVSYLRQRFGRLAVDSTEEDEVREDGTGEVKIPVVAHQPKICSAHHFAGIGRCSCHDDIM